MVQAPLTYCVRKVCRQQQVRNKKHMQTDAIHTTPILFLMCTRMHKVLT